MRKNQNHKTVGVTEIRQLPEIWQKLFERLPQIVSYADLVQLGFYASNKSASGAIRSDPYAPQSYHIGTKIFFDKAELVMWLYHKHINYGRYERKVA